MILITQKQIVRRLHGLAYVAKIHQTQIERHSANAERVQYHQKRYSEAIAEGDRLGARLKVF